MKRLTFPLDVPVDAVFLESLEDVLTKIFHSFIVLLLG
jgi:hypothetical protein